MSEMKSSAVAEMEGWFERFVSSFPVDDSELQLNLEIKKGHTERVVQEITWLGRSLRLSDGDLNLARVIALFHDVGRFEQYSRYRTFADRKSADHALLGLEILERHDVLARLDREDQEIIIFAVRYHNKPVLPAEGSSRSLFFLRLIRDADKLDIWKVITDYYHRSDESRNVALELELSDTSGYSERVLDNLKHGNIVNMNDVHNLNDIKLLQAGWVFDINFQPAMEAVRSRRYIDLIRSVLPESGELDDVFAGIRLFMDKKCNMSAVMRGNA